VSIARNELHNRLPIMFTCFLTFRITECEDEPQNLGIYTWLAHVHVVEQRVGGIARIVIVMAGQGQRIGMTCRDTARNLYPGSIIRAGLGKQRDSRSSRIVLQGSGSPVIGHGVRTMHLIPEFQCALSARDGEGLAD